jgi:hypothetical protein
MIRPRLLYVSTEDVRPYEDAQQVTISLRDQITAEDGFKLVYGVRSFGFDTNVMNISVKQNNYQLDFECSYKNANEEYQNGIVVTVPGDNFTTKIFTIQLSDGNYTTVDNLFEEINFQISNVVESGWLRDITKDKNFPTNVIPFTLQFLKTKNNQFTIDINNVIIDTLESYTFGGVTYPAYDFANPLASITIQPTPGSPGLFNLLFTNKESSIPNKPVCLPSFSLQTGKNPPDGIEFLIDLATYRTYGQDVTTLGQDVINVAETIIYYLKEKGNEDLINTFEGIYPIDNYLDLANLPYISYQLPDIFPIYLDVKSTLENNNLTKEGLAKNLLLRQFIIGGSDGNNSFLQTWDTPIYHILDSRSITSLELKFESEGDKWNFFNLQFALELIVFEVEDEVAVPDFQEPVFVMPGEDGLTNAINRYSNSVQNPMALAGSGQSKRVVAYNDILNRRVKKPRL